MSEARADRERWFELLPDLRLQIAGAGDVLYHYDREYGPARTREKPAEVHVAVAFGGVTAADAVLTGGHKTVGWRVALGDPGASPLAARIGLGGRPHWFALSLTQGYFVEPLLAMAAARAGHVLVPAAAVVTDGGLVLLLGGSGAGKTSLSTRALSDGLTVLGDDQVFVDGRAMCSRFPRRLRLYADVAQTVPQAYARLSHSNRARLLMRRGLELASRGYVRPSLAVDYSELSGGALKDPRPAAQSGLLRWRIARVVVLDAVSTGRLEAHAVDRATAVDIACRHLEAQRVRMSTIRDDRWRTALRLLLESERRILTDAFAEAALERVAVPRTQRPEKTLSELSTALGLRAPVPA